MGDIGRTEADYEALREAADLKRKHERENPPEPTPEHVEAKKRLARLKLAVEEATGFGWDELDISGDWDERMDLTEARYALVDRFNASLSSSDVWISLGDDPSVLVLGSTDTMWDSGYVPYLLVDLETGQFAHVYLGLNGDPRWRAAPDA